MPISRISCETLLQLFIVCSTSFYSNFTSVLIKLRLIQTDEHWKLLKTQKQGFKTAAWNNYIDIKIITAKSIIHFVIVM